MRSIVRRTLAPLASLTFVTAISSVASADPSATTGVQVITRQGSSTPWLHLAPSAARSRVSPSTNETVVVDVEARARVALGRVSPSATARNITYVATATDRFGDGEAVVHFEQTHGGLPVVGRGAAVRLSSSGEAILTAVDLEESLPASTIASVPKSVAVKMTSKVAVGTVTEKDVHLVVWPLRGGGSRLAYVVLPQVPAGLPSSPRIIIDAQNGKVLESRDLVQFAKARVHRFNPTKTPQLEILDLPMAPSPTAAGKLANDFVVSSNCIDRKSVKAVDLGGGFKTNLHVCDLEQLAVADGSGDFLYTPTDTPGAMASRSDEYSEVSIYYHTTKAYEFFRALQGVPDAQVVVDKPLRVVANLQIPAGITSGNLLAAADPNTPLETFSNAFFSPAGGGLGQIFEQIYGVKGGGLWFGQGPQRDYAYDGDVVYHELGHAVVDKTIKLAAWHVDARGAIDSPGAMNEGLADYFSSAITGDPDVGEYASKEAGQSAGVIRTLTNKDKCPTSVIGEVHYDSTLFSGALWQARVSLPEADRTKFDAAIYKAMRSSPGNGDLGFDDAAKLFAATLSTDLPAGKTALEAAMTDRGVLPSCERIFEFTGAPIKAIEPVVGGFTAPGTQSVSFADLAPGIIQVHGKSTPDSAHQLVVSFTSRKAAAGGGPLGGQASAYAPVVLAKFGKPITWTPNAKTGGSHDADLTADVTGTTAQTATFEVPAGTSDVYIQIANKGESDGAYDGVSLAFGPSTIDPPVTDPPPADPTTTDGPVVTTTSCGCTTPGNASHPALPLGLVAGLALAAGVVRRRRRD